MYLFGDSLLYLFCQFITSSSDSSKRFSFPLAGADNDLLFFNIDDFSVDIVSDILLLLTTFTRGAGGCNVFSASWHQICINILTLLSLSLFSLSLSLSLSLSIQNIYNTCIKDTQYINNLNIWISWHHCQCI